MADSFSKPILVDACQLTWQAHHSVLIGSLSKTAFFELENTQHEKDLIDHERNIHNEKVANELKKFWEDERRKQSEKDRKAGNRFPTQESKDLWTYSQDWVDGTWAKHYRDKQLTDEEKAFPVHRHLLATRRAMKDKLWKQLWEAFKNKPEAKRYTHTVQSWKSFADVCKRAWSKKPSMRHQGMVLSGMLDASRAEKMCESLTICSGYSCKDGGCELFTGSNFSSDEGYDTHVKDLDTRQHGRSDEEAAYIVTLCPWFMDWHLQEQGGIYHPSHKLTFPGSCNITREYEIAQCGEQQGRVQASCHTFGVWLQSAQTHIARMKGEMAMKAKDAKLQDADQKKRASLRLAEDMAEAKVELAQKAAEARNPPFSVWGIIETVASITGPFGKFLGVVFGNGKIDAIAEGIEAVSEVVGSTAGGVEFFSEGGGGDGEFEDEQHAQEHFEAVSEMITASEKARMQERTEKLHAELDFLKETVGAVGSEIGAAQSGADALWGVLK